LNQVNEVGEFDTSGGNVNLTRIIQLDTSSTQTHFGFTYNRTVGDLFITGGGTSGQYNLDGDLVRPIFTQFTPTPVGLDIVAYVPEPQAPLAATLMLVLLGYRRSHRA
ncbi:MAG: hypothetical protein AAGF97_09350, partial [Planctomycetota bacterium]